MNTSLAPPAGAVLVCADEVSLVRLHGEACWHCGAVSAGLQTVGEVSTASDGGYRIWPVVGCVEHRSQPVGPAARPSVMQSTPGVLLTAHRGGVTTRDPAQIVHPGDCEPRTEIAVRCLGGDCAHCGVES